MDDLSLLLASREVFLSLSMQKIKTLKQAQQLQTTVPHPKLQTVLNQHRTLKSMVFSSMNDQQRELAPSQIHFNFSSKEPLKYYWTNPTVVEIIGLKGSGKTALALNSALQFSKLNSQKTITILNCGGGITLNRLSPFLKLKHDYIDIFSVEDIQEALISLKKKTIAGLVMLDGVYSLIMGASQRIGLGEHLTSLREQGWILLVTNLIQGKLEVEQKEVMNTQSYFPNIFGGIVDCRLRIDEDQSLQSTFVVRTLKILNSKSYQFTGEMGERGLGQLSIQRQA